MVNIWYRNWSPFWWYGSTPLQVHLAYKAEVLGSNLFGSRFLNHQIILIAFQNLLCRIFWLLRKRLPWYCKAHVSILRASVLPMWLRKSMSKFWGWMNRLRVLPAFICLFPSKNHSYRHLLLFQFICEHYNKCLSIIRPFSLYVNSSRVKLYHA